MSLDLARLFAWVGVIIMTLTLLLASKEESLVSKFFKLGLVLVIIAIIKKFL